MALWKIFVLTALLAATVSAVDEKTDPDLGLLEAAVVGIENAEKPDTNVEEAEDAFAQQPIQLNEDAIDSAAPKAHKKAPQSDSKPEAAKPKVAHLRSDHKGGYKANGANTAAGNTVFLVTVGAASIAGLVGIVMAGVCYYKYRNRSKAATEVGYPAYGETGPAKERLPSPGDRKLAQSAQMYHYQHQKQQMIAMEKANGDMKHDASDDDSEEDNIEGDYTVYECPGLAPTGEMEVKNPLFRGDDAPPAAPEHMVTGHSTEANGHAPVHGMEAH